MIRNRRKDSARQSSQEAPSHSSDETPVRIKLHNILERANDSERHGMKFGLFPSWVEDYQLSNKEFAQLITLAQEMP